MSGGTMDPTWIERDGRRVWSESWEAKRGVPFTPAEVESLRAQAKQHLDDATRDGKVPAMAWVIVERVLATTDVPCFTCRGSGRITILHRDDPGFHDERCPECRHTTRPIP